MGGGGGRGTRTRWRKMVKKERKGSNWIKNLATFLKEMPETDKTGKIALQLIGPKENR